jgi:hypothetical protein
MQYAKESTVVWPEPMPEYHIAVQHPKGIVHFCKYDPKSADNGCGHYPYLDNGGCRPDMRYWQVLTVYPMVSYEEREALGRSVNQGIQLQSTSGLIVVKSYNRAVDRFHVEQVNDEATPLVLRKDQIKFT